MIDSCQFSLSLQHMLMSSPGPIRCESLGHNEQLTTDTQAASVYRITGIMAHRNMRSTPSIIKNAIGSIIQPL